jgi:hypothetical protein
MAHRWAEDLSSREGPRLPSAVARSYLISDARISAARFSSLAIKIP